MQKQEDEGETTTQRRGEIREKGEKCVLSQEGVERIDSLRSASPTQHMLVRASFLEENWKKTHTDAVFVH